MLPDLPRRALSNPAGLIQLLDSLYAADLLIVALTELDFFTWLADHPADEAGVAAAFRLAERPTDVMLTLFAAMGLINKERGVFRVATLAREHLVRGSPWYLGADAALLKQRPACAELLHILRTDEPSSHALPVDEEAVAAAQDGRGAYFAPALADLLPLTGDESLLDVGGGTGINACYVAARYPELTAAVVEHPPLDRIAQRAINKRQLEDRVAVITADLFAEPLPRGFDMHLYAHVLHNHDEPHVRVLLARSFAALPPGGLIAIYDAHINSGKTGPLEVAQYSVLLLHQTRGKCYSTRELEDFLADVGFIQFDYSPGRANRSLITARKPAR